MVVGFMKGMRAALRSGRHLLFFFFFGGWIEGGRETWMRRGRRWEWGERRTALVRELTCSHTLNSSARASSLSVWGRWISQTLRETPLTPFPPPPPPDPCFTGVLFPRICFYLWRCLIAVQTGGKGFLSGMPIGFTETCL